MRRRQETRFGARRPVQTRDPRPIIVIACDDTATAPAYFANLKETHELHCSLRVVPARNHGASGKDVVDEARLELQKFTENEGDSAWALVDLETASENDPAFRQLRSQAKTARVHLALSKPCYEVWTLAHFISTGEHFQNCAAVLTKLKRHWKVKFGEAFPQKKAQAKCEKLLPLTRTALENAGRHGPSTKSQSWTQVGDLVSEILSHIPKDQKN